MQTKNIYLLFPAGYSGNYLKWALDVSNKDIFDNVVKNPLNPKRSHMFGGRGTSHLHTRLPSHHCLKRTMAWINLNRPTDFRTYLLDEGGHNHDPINLLMQQDPSGVFINIHANNDPIVESYAEINAMIKWPSTVYSGLTRTVRHEVADFDLFNSADNVVFRNFLVRNYGYNANINTPLRYEWLDKYLGLWHEWHVIRNKFHPHEINSDTYLMERQEYTNRIFEISCADIASPTLPDFVEEVLKTSNALSNFDCSHLREFHQQYIDAQDNLQWFKSIKEWQKNYALDEYLQSHSAIQAQLLKEMFRQSGVAFITYDERERWEIQCIWLERLNKIMYPPIEGTLLKGVLPDFFFISSDAKNSPMGELITSGRWKTMSLFDINEFFKGTR